jgi:hypothetical protein
MNANAKKKKLTLSIEMDLTRRLDFEAALRGKGHDRSSIVGDLVDRHIALPADWKPLAVEVETLPEWMAAKAPARQRDKATFYFSPMTAMQLSLYARRLGFDQSDIVEGLIRAYVTPWDIYDPRTHHTSANPTNRRKKGTNSNEEDRATGQAA